MVTLEDAQAMADRVTEMVRWSPTFQAMAHEVLSRALPQFVWRSAPADLGEADKPGHIWAAED